MELAVPASFLVIFYLSHIILKGTRFMAISLSVGLLILRLVAGLTLAVHGTQKLFGWFGGPGLTRLTQGFGKQGFKPVWLWASLVIVGEVGGGVSLVLGFLTQCSWRRSRVIGKTASSSVRAAMSIR